LPAVELRALARVVAQRDEHRVRCRQEAVLTGGRGQLVEARTQHETALHVSCHQPVVLEGDREAVRRRTGQTGGGDELRQGGRAGLESPEDGRRLVQDADSASIVHTAILPSRNVRLEVERPSCLWWR